MESIWKPVAANEGFEVVRRRLFLPCKNEAERDRICTVFSQFYNENKADFPIEASEVTYRDRMISCYPIHPEIFDRLYNDWSTLERSQRTRGVLRLMAAVLKRRICDMVMVLSQEESSEPFFLEVRQRPAVNLQKDWKHREFVWVQFNLRKILLNLMMH